MSETEEKKPRLGTVREACALGKMSRSKLYNKINAGIIKAYKRGGTETLIDLDTVDAMLGDVTPYIPR